MSRLVALVVLHPANGSLRGDVPITSADLEGFLPAAADVATVVDWFTAAGFEVEAPGAICFSIGADTSVYERWFGTTDGPFDIEELPPRIRRLVAAVEVESAPDFGPGNP